VLNLLPVPVATVLGPTPTPTPPLVPCDPATLTDAEAGSSLAGAPPSAWCSTASPTGTRTAAGGTTAAGKAGSCGRYGDDLVAYEASRGSGLLVVEATLRRTVHRPVTGADGSRLPALVEYRLTGAGVVDRPER
jgi:hypothetical protein